MFLLLLLKDCPDLGVGLWEDLHLRNELLVFINSIVTGL